MNIKGLQKTTLLDYPGHVAATIFIGGCNFRCPFCHNMDIVINNSGEIISEEEIFAFLKKRAGILEGVCITGGEPTLYKELPDFLKKIKQLGYIIKLDTNGTNPEMIKQLINDSIIDYIAMDIKTSYDNYFKVAGIDELSEEIAIKNNYLDKIKESVAFLKTGIIDHEFRTTIVAQYHNIEEVEKIGKMLEGEDKFFLQSFKESEYVADKTLTAISKDCLNQFVEILRKYIKNPQIRGVD